MTAASAGTPSQSLLSALAAALCVPLVTACSDDQPTEDVAQISPSDVTQAQLVSEPNALGQSPNLDKRWR
ncbi:hypothetical protein [Hydrogenophaga sp.]|uniref:hypothetical protein n=1 Tax=Hydrogenophaga sp. TaxID=1904254 RepID=UPI0025C3C24B|nr:hypothetical protein [Hydrogenophaga sp.]